MLGPTIKLKLQCLGHQITFPLYMIKNSTVLVEAIPSVTGDVHWLTMQSK
jgi:hypothetical protein